jgi:hypothetical protein
MADVQGLVDGLCGCGGNWVFIVFLILILLVLGCGGCI